MRGPPARGEAVDGARLPRGRDGRRTVHLPSGGAVLRRAEPAPRRTAGGAARDRRHPEAAPLSSPGGPLAPGLAVCLAVDGRWQIHAERLSRLAAGPTPEAGTLVACRSDLGGVAHRFLPGDQPWRELSVAVLGGTFTGAPPPPSTPWAAPRSRSSAPTDAWPSPVGPPPVPRSSDRGR